MKARDSINDRIKIYGDHEQAYNNSLPISVNNRQQRSIDDIRPEQIENLIPSFGLPFIEK